MPAELLQSSEVEFLPLPSHDDLPSILSEASVLLLPESFNQNRHLIEYSISTKAHLYMMSRRPVLVYGPSYSGTVDYAVLYGWGLVVSERNVAKLKEAFIEIFTGSNRINKMRQCADACIKSNHNRESGIKRFYELLENGIQNYHV
jgi:glycosyltransferase involved in cell wall biosynthesis